MPLGSDISRVDGEQSSVHWHIQDDGSADVIAWISAVEFIMEKVRAVMEDLDKANTDTQANHQYAKGNIIKPGRIIIMKEPKDFKTEEFTRLQEARGSHLIACIAYVYENFVDEKNVTFYGPTFEIGRYPLTVDVKEDKRKKRKIEDVSSAQPESEDA
jgi:hypothetical protein